MHRYLPFLLLALCLTARAADTLYDKTISLPPTASASAKASASTLASWLNRMTGETFAVVDAQPPRGICLALAGDVDLPRDADTLKKESNPEAFLLASDGRETLWIVGNTDLGLERGVYWYLDLLGCRWLHASAKWTIVPKRGDIRMKIATVQTPAFALRDFFGTGGFGRPAIDPKQRKNDEWALYRRENLLGGTFHLGGHTGEAFNLAHKTELIAHPEYLAELNGVRQPWDQGTKPCYANPGLQTLYIQDRLNWLKNNPTARSVSVEPGDGGGHCDCAECRKLGSVSDRVFTLANAVARAVAKDYPGKYVNLYGYNEHAAPPVIALEPNVIVSIVPYGFQRTGLTPEEFITAWGAKAPVLGLYDYWDIPDWSRNLPDLSLDTVTAKVRFWHAQRVGIFTAESTFCGGSMSLNWYVASRLLWDPARDAKAIADDFFTQAFGPAQAPIRAMYATWGSRFMLTDHELGVCFRAVQDALALTDDPAIRARLVDMGRYVHYLRLYYEYQQAAGPAKVERAKALVTYLWRIYESNMVQSFRLAQLLNRDMRPNLDDVNPDQAMWKDIPQLTDAEVLELLADGARTYTPLDFQPKTFAGALTPLTAGMPGDRRVATNIFGVSTSFAFHVPAQGPKEVRLRIHVGNNPGKADRVKATDPAGAVVLAQTVPADGQWAELVIPTEKSGLYALSVIDQKNQFSLEVPAALPFVVTGGLTSTAVSPRIYFYVPKGTQQAVVYSPGVVPLKLFDPQGKPVTVARNEAKQALFLIDIPDGMDGRCWSFAWFKAWEPIRLLNCPNVFSFSPEGMMVPAEAVETK